MGKKIVVFALVFAVLFLLILGNVQMTNAEPEGGVDQTGKLWCNTDAYCLLHSEQNTCSKCQEKTETQYFKWMWENSIDSDTGEIVEKQVKGPCDWVDIIIGMCNTEEFQIGRCITLPTDEECTSQGGVVCGKCNCCFADRHEQCTQKGECCIWYGEKNEHIESGEASKIVCCDKMVKVEYDNRGYPDCCSVGQKTYKAAEGSAYAKERPWIIRCCDKGVEVDYNYRGYPSCCMEGEKAYKVAEGSAYAKEHPWVSICCNKEEEVAYHEDGYPTCCWEGEKAVPVLNAAGTEQLKKGWTMCCKEGEKAIYNPTKAFVECVVSCTVKYCFQIGTFCGFGKISLDSDIEKEYVGKYECLEDKKICSKNPSDNPDTKNVDESIIPFVREVCEDSEICLEQRFYDKSSSGRVRPFNSAVCSECPSSLSFGGHQSKDYLWNCAEIDAGKYNPTKKRVDGTEVQVPYVVDNVKIVDNIAGAFSELQRVCSKCRKQNQNWKLEFASFHGHIATWDKIENLALANYPNVAGCVEKAITTDCGSGGSNSPPALSNALGGTPVIAGKEGITHAPDSDECRGHQILGNPVIYPDKEGVTELRTIFYLTNPDSLYPGFRNNIYQVKVIEGDISKVKVRIESDESNVFLVEMKNEQAPCDVVSLEKKEFVLLPNQPIVFDKLSIISLLDTFTRGSDSAIIEIENVVMDCAIYNELYPDRLQLLNEVDFEVARQLLAENAISSEYYDDFKYRYENQLECTKDEHCLGLRCPMSNLSCAHVCKSWKCEIESDGSKIVRVGEGNADSNNDDVVSLQELMNYIQKWVNGEVSLNGLVGAIRSWTNSAN